jgi:menaquinol-cytochrome c reductase iron-sulfur subunit
VADPSGSHADSNDTAQAAGGYADPASARAAVSRGRFLSGVTLGLGGLIGAAITVPAVGFALGPSFSGEAWYWVNLGSTSQFPVGPNYTTVLFERTPEGTRLDRRIAFVRQNPASTYTIISNTCMHLGCPVKSVTPPAFACPCHGGQYDSEGRVTAGPPVRPLNRYEYKIESGELLIGQPFACEEKADGRVVMTHVFRDPGQPSTGLLSFLYPEPIR